MKFIVTLMAHLSFVVVAVGADSIDILVKRALNERLLFTARMLMDGGSDRSISVEVRKKFEFRTKAILNRMRTGSFVEQLYADSYLSQQRRDQAVVLSRWEKFLITAKLHDPQRYSNWIQEIEPRYQRLKKQGEPRRAVVELSSATTEVGLSRPSLTGAVKSTASSRLKPLLISAGTLERVLERGDREMARGRLDEALRLYQYACRIDPSSVVAKKKMAEVGRLMD